MMASKFDYFVLFAEMRTGSNFLENNLNELAEVECFGEVFNPRFLGAPDRETLFGFNRAGRDKDPEGLLNAIRDEATGLGGFRFFHDHHPAVIDPVLDDERCAKVILTRNPVESYVSWRIAEATDQWVLTDAAHRVKKKAVFREEEFLTHLKGIHEFQVRIIQGLQRRGQTAFFVSYEDIQNIDVINGIAAFLGVPSRLKAHDTKLTRQNPDPMSEKVENYDAMLAALSRVDWANMSQTPNFEPRRAPTVPSYVAAASTPLLHMPMPSGPSDGIETWLASLDGVEPGDLTRNFTQKSLRQWKNRNTPHRGFTVVRHPVRRLYRTFYDRIFDKRPGAYLKLRHILIDNYGLTMPRHDPDPNWSVADHRECFLKFLSFIKQSNNGQTAIRVDSTWATQAQIMQGFSEFATPDLVLREDRLNEDLPALTAMVGCDAKSYVEPADNDPIPLSEIYDPEIEAAVRDVHQRDYMMFGFGALAI